MKDPGDGLHLDISENDYHASSRVSRSVLWKMKQSPAHCREYQLNPPDSPVFDMGRAIHCAGLEPHLLDDNFSARPEGINARTNAGKAQIAAWREENAGKTLLEGPHDMEVLRGVSAALLAHPVASKMLTGDGLTEASAYWTDEHTGLQCRARHDRVIPYKSGYASADLKSYGGKELTDRAIQYSVLDFGYHVQAGMYLESLDQVAGEMPRAFVLIFVEKKPPFGIRIFELDIGYIEAGRALFRKLLNEYAACKASGEWPSYPSAVTMLEAPEWL